jgi:serine/threonine protein kinase
MEFVSGKYEWLRFSILCHNDVIFAIDLEEFWKEATLLSKLRPHSNIVTFLGVCLQPFCVIFEFLPNGNLRSHLDASSSKITSSEQLKWFRGIAAGLLHLSYEGIVHRDLAARNILLTASLEGKVQLCMHLNLPFHFLLK